MISAKIESIDFKKVFKNTVQYTEGFIQGISLNRLEFNRVLGGYTAESLGMYIDSKARMNSSTLHHVYEWGKVGDSSARLFKINVNATNTSIVLNGKFIPSTQPGSDSGQVFFDKANVMENGISVTISPKKSSVLVFQDESDTVFTTNSIYVAHPGGDQVAGSFGRTVEEFFDFYFVFSILEPLMKKLRNPKEFSKMFLQGTKSGRSVGVRAGRKYFSMSGDKLI